MTIEWLFNYTIYEFCHLQTCGKTIERVEMAFCYF